MLWHHNKELFARVVGDWRYHRVRGDIMRRVREYTKTICSSCRRYVIRQRNSLLEWLLSRCGARRWREWALPMMRHHLTKLFAESMSRQALERMGFGDGASS
mmetsp:Transcript_4151/g.7302  ORF Transcript_4151/g.7302 Transcript_4151/m.7302 type:complete len:102 (-) Transcript_4151:37-342(-)